MPAPDRITRVNEILKRELADLIEREVFMDGTCLLSITSVDTAPNLRTAIVRVSVFAKDTDASKEAMKFLKKRRIYLQKKIAKHVILKYTPVLSFELDNTLQKGDAIITLIEKMEQDDNT